MVINMGNDIVTITIEGEKREYKKGITFETIAEDYQEKYDHLIALVTENGKIRELIKTANKDSELTFITLKSSIGHKAYVRSAIMLLLKSVSDVLGKEQTRKIKVEFAIGQGYYCNLDDDYRLSEADVQKVSARMNELVKADLPIVKKSYPLEEAIALFKHQGHTEKEKLFRYRRSSSVNIYSIEDYHDYYYGYMLPSTGYLKFFNILLYENGFMLLIPEQEEPSKIAYFEPREKLFATMMQASQWDKKMGINTVGDLNNIVCRGEIADMILVQEALQERRIGQIAEDIIQHGGVKFVMIAGPSSSGKTTFSHRLSIQLRTYGRKPHPIGLDDYYLDRTETPRDEDGNYDFECLEAIDIKQFNQDMSDLLAGKTVELPSYNFKTGRREYRGNVKTLGPEDILVIEGIHGLNHKTAYALPDESKYKIYISALTSLNVDGHNRIPTTDGRLLRRMVRDARTRGAGAKQTIQMWPSVRRGEEAYIFPFQESADAMFNSALIYELAVIKGYAEPLLFSIGKDEPEYYEAKRLLKFLEYFVGVGSELVPSNSICREFVGGSIFHA